MPRKWRQAVYERWHAVYARTFPDRRYLERHILPWLVAHSGPHIVSIGCRAYTVHYEAMVERLGGDFATVDLDPEAGRHGAKRHVVKSVTDLTASDFPAGVDGILFNGVIGWGLDGPDQIDRAFGVLSGLLRPGSLLVVGWNTDRSADPMLRLAHYPSLSLCDGPTGATRVTFPNSTHVYDFLRRT